MRKKLIGIVVCMLLITTCVVPVIGELLAIKKSSNDANSLHASNTVLKFMIAGKAIRALHSYWIHVPPGYDGSKPVPLVLVFQGTNSNTDYPLECFRRCIMENATKLSEKADQEGFIVVYANAKLFYHHMESGDNKAYDYNYAWIPSLELDYIDDIGFIRALIIKMKQEYNINSSRIYATGFSAGAYLTSSVGGYLSDEVAAIAPVCGSTIGGRLNENDPMSYIPTPENPISVMVLYGTKDPYENRPLYVSVNDSIAFWVEHNGCNPVPDINTSVSGKTIRSTYIDGESGTEVVLCTMVGWSHGWPTMITATSEIIATDTVWEFFESHPKQ